MIVSVCNEGIQLKEIKKIDLSHSLFIVTLHLVHFLGCLSYETLYLLGTI